MSLRAHVWVAELQGITWPERGIVTKMANYANDDGGSIWPSVKTLATWAGKSERTIQTVLSSLLEIGLIDVDGSNGREGGARPTTYRIVIPDDYDHRAKGARNFTPPARQSSNRGVQVSARGVKVSAPGGVQKVAPETSRVNHSKGNLPCRSHGRSPSERPSDVAAAMDGVCKWSEPFLVNRGCRQDDVARLVSRLFDRCPLGRGQVEQTILHSQWMNDAYGWLLAIPLVTPAAKAKAKGADKDANPRTCHPGTAARH